MSHKTKRKNLVEKGGKNLYDTATKKISGIDRNTNKGDNKMCIFIRSAAAHAHFIVSSGIYEIILQFKKEKYLSLSAMYNLYDKNIKNKRKKEQKKKEPGFK